MKYIIEYQYNPFKNQTLTQTEYFDNLKEAEEAFERYLIKFKNYKQKYTIVLYEKKTTKNILKEYSYDI